jgi:hypothetical protein
MKISLKELLRLEKYLNGLGRRINRFGMDGDEQPMDIDSYVINVVNGNINKADLESIIARLQATDNKGKRKRGEKERNIEIKFNNNDNIETISTTFTDLIVLSTRYGNIIDYEDFKNLLNKVSPSSNKKQKDVDIQLAEKKKKVKELPGDMVSDSNLEKFKTNFVEGTPNYNTFEALKKLIKEKSIDQTELDKIVKDNTDLLKEKNKKKNSSKPIAKLINDIDFLEYMRNKLQERILKPKNEQTPVKMDIQEDVGQSSSSQPPLSHTLSEPQPPFGPGLVGKWVYHPKNDYSKFFDYIGLIEKYETLKENGKDVANITIIWIPTSADYQNIGKKNICADIDNSENCNATTTDNCEWKEQTARSKGKCIVRDEVKCTGLNETDCNNTDTCNWNGKKCTKKILVDNIDNFLKYNYIIDDLNEKEYLDKGIQVIEKPTYEDIETITITVDQDNDGIYLKLLAQLDAIKDFYGSGGSDYHNVQQLNILKNYIAKIIQNIPPGNSNLKNLLDLFTAGNEKSQDRNRKQIMDQIYVELEEKLGIQSYPLEGITDMLFPTGTSSRLINKKEQIERFVLYHLNNKKLAEHLKDISDIYKREESDEGKLGFIETFMNPEIYMTGLDQMIVWVEGSANRNNISTLVPMLRFNNIDKVSPRSFATYIDAAAKTNILTDSIGYFDVNTIGIDQPQVRYNIQTNNGELLISFRVKRIGTQASINNPLYVVEIDNFFGLDCTDVGPLAYIGPNISISGVWDRIKMLLFNSTEKLINNEKRNTQVDLCMKANKTLMDMLKGIITMEYKKSQAGRNTVIFSVFPDLNGARFMAANSSDGVTLHTVSSRSPRIFLKKRIFDILFDRTMGFGKKKMNEIDYLIKLVKRM